CLQSKNFPWTF
nr:immunoglobulin light chain junction region [Macaca mulatta]MOV64424.1 immunoglobulin light chain junction region [Macaca mulatta]MOX51842.1 immunoglobulin light chain junction region [Macaca mulatta]MOX51867.1 immunoglobulin light chain junction region [Macaca mulatta]MOX51877.1 immunoglobulin light chain junction region [Macaca mulatta]